MPLTGPVKAYTKYLLEFLLEEEVLSLAQTVTNHQITLHTCDEAVEAILTYSQTPEELLKRKKIKRHSLFKYLASQKVVVDPNAEKHTLINAIVKFWKENEARENGSVSTVTQHTTYKEDTHTTVTNTDGPYQFARQFAEWFYEALNGCNPCYPGQTSESFTSKHFYSDCSMKLLTKTVDVQQEDLTGGETVHLRLRSFPSDEHLLFNPNLEIGGVEGKINSHGLAMVHVCGTIHRQSSVLGVFEQRFGLVKDPSMQFNWRVKFTNLCMQSGEAVASPKLGMGLARLLPST